MSWYYFYEPTTPDASKGEMHLVSISAYCDRVAADRPVMTLCRQGIAHMTGIDDTATGNLTTCPDCRRNAKLAKR